MPIKTVTKADMVKQFGPTGLPTESTMPPDMDLYRVCSECRNLPSLERALDKKADVNARSVQGWSPLMHVANAWCHSQAIPFAKRLLELKADPNIETDGGSTVLDMCNEHTETWDEKRLMEIKHQKERRDIMDGKGESGFGFGPKEWRGKELTWNQPLADELPTFSMLPALRELKDIFEEAGGKPGPDPFSRPWLSDEEYIEKRDELAARNAERLKKQGPTFKP